MDVACVDLKARFGRKCRVARDPSYAAEYGETAYKPDPWLWQIPCQNGHVYPYGGDYLGAATNSRGPVATRLMGLEGVEVTQDGDDGVNVRFHVDRFDAVAQVLKPRRRRRLSPEQRAKCAATLAKHRPEPVRRGPQNERTRVPAGVGDS